MLDLLVFIFVFALSACSGTSPSTSVVGSVADPVAIPSILPGPAASGAPISAQFTFHSDDNPVLSYDESAAAPVVQELNDPTGQISLTSSLPGEAAAQDASIGSHGPAPGSASTLAILLGRHAPPGFVSSGIRSFNIVVGKLELTQKGTGQVIQALDSPVTLDLLSIRSGFESLLALLRVPPGSYSQLRLYVSGAWLEIAKQRVGISVPAAYSRAGIRIFGSFSIKPGSLAQVTLDLDLERLLLWSARGPLLRELASLRHIDFTPAGIHFEQAPDGTMSLIGPAHTVRKNTALQLIDTEKNIHRQRAKKDGSFRFDGIPRVYGQVELDILKNSGDDDDNPGWIVAWVKFLLDFAVDPAIPNLRASALDSLLKASYDSVGGDSASFLALFSTDPFRYLAGEYLLARGQELPAGFALPVLSAAYPFALQGPEYALPDYASTLDSIGFFSGGPASPGCGDARQVFEGAAPANDYGRLSADGAVSRMIQAGLPFTGLLAHYEVICRQQDLATLSCGTLGSLATASATSLPAETLADLAGALNTPRGGLITALLGCAAKPAQVPAAVSLPPFPTQTPGCWYGCADDSPDLYLAPSQLLAAGDADQILSTAAPVQSLDDLVLVANQANVPPLVLAASYLAEHATSKVHGYLGRLAPQISNVIPVSGLTASSSMISVSASVSDRSTTRVLINGTSVSFGLDAAGTVQVPPILVGLEAGDNVITIQATNLQGLQGSAQIHVFYAPPVAPSPSPSLSPTPAPSVVSSPLPSPSPSPSPAASGIAGVSALCSNGDFLAKSSIRVGLSMNPNEGSLPLVQSGFQALGFTTSVYSDDDVAAQKPVADGITVLVIAREATLGAVTQAYVDGVKAYIASGGSIIAEYDGAALLFDTFVGGGPLIPNFNPFIGLFSAQVAGGAAILPITNSTQYIVDPNDPIMAGMPSSFLLGPRAGFAISGFNDNWLHTSATFTASGYLGIVPAGTFPAVLSGQCGSGRIALFTMTDLQVMSSFPVNLMFTNTLHWLTGT